MSYSKQVEIASGGKNGRDFELVDHSDGKGIQIKPLNPGFVIPTKAKINAAKAKVDSDEASINAAMGNIHSLPSGTSPAKLEERLSNLEAVVGKLLSNA